MQTMMIILLAVYLVVSFIRLGGKFVSSLDDIWFGFTQRLCPPVPVLPLSTSSPSEGKFKEFEFRFQRGPAFISLLSWVVNFPLKAITILQSMINVKHKTSKRFGPAMNGIIKAIKIMPQTLHVILKLAFLHCELRLIQVNLDP